KRTLDAVIVIVLALALMSCTKQPSTTSADSFQPRTAPEATEADNVKTARVEKVKAEAADKVKPEAKITIPAGTKLRVALLDAVSSDKSRPGKEFMASLTEPVIVNGKTVFAKGTKIRGRVVEAKESGRVKGRASLELTLTQIVAREGRSLSISTRPYTAVAE